MKYHTVHIESYQPTYLLHGAVVLLLPADVLIQQRFVLAVLRRHGFEEGRFPLRQPERPLAPKSDYLLAFCRVMVRGALAPGGRKDTVGGVRGRGGREQHIREFQDFGSHERETVPCEICPHTWRMLGQQYCHGIAYLGSMISSTIGDI